MRHFITICALTVFLHCASFAQTQTAQISGVVSDTSGGLIVDSEILVTNSDTGVKRTGRSNETGIFTIPLLNPGSYDIVARKQGFRSVSRSGVKLYVNDRAQIDFILEVGSISETVTVATSVPLTETQSGTVRRVVDQQRIQDLPLNGRDITKLVTIQAGVVALGGDEKEGFSFSSNGSRGNGVAYLLDGGYNTHSYRGFSGLFPNPDAVQEFSIQTNNFSAEYGNATGAVVSAITRSGTNQFHGSAFEFLRNGHLNARNFFAPVRDTLKRNQYGATLGGPVLRDRIFFFVSYQNTRLRSDPAIVPQFLPTAATRAGDFSASRRINDPLIQQPFPGNQIPRSRLNPVSLAFLRYLPDPGTPNGQRFIGGVLNPDEPEYLARVDANLGRHSLSGRMFVRRFKKPFGANLQDYASMYSSDVADQVQDQDHITASDIFTVSPRLINSFTFTFKDRTTAQDWSKSRIPFTFADAGVKGIGVPDPPGVFIDVSGDFLARPGRHATLVHKDLHWADTATYSNGKHEIKFGGEVIWSSKVTKNTFNSTGTFSFDGFSSGLAAADFMLGDVRQFVQGGGEYADVSGYRWGFFVQDNFRIRPTLTLTFGLRWDPTVPINDNTGRGVQCFREGERSTHFPNSPVGYLHSAGDAGCPQGGFDSFWPALSPRLGFAWNAASGFVVRGGYGVFWNPQFTALYNTFGGAPHNPQILRMAVKFDDPYQGVVNPFPAQFGPSFVAPSNAPFITPLGAIGSFDRNFTPSYVQSYNLTVERAMAANTVVRASYVGTLGRRLSYNENINYGRYAPGATVANIQQRRPFSQYNGILVANAGSTSSYHALQVSLERRVAKGLSFEANYTFSKAIDEFSTDPAPGSGQMPIPFNRRTNRGVADFDIPSRFVASLVWSLPSLSQYGSLVKHVLGGWQVTGISTLRSGTPFSAVSGSDLSFSGINGDYADLVGDPFLDSGRPRKDLIAGYFNKRAFAPNRVGTFGSSPRNLLRAPGAVNFDTGVMKDFRATERVTMQVRWEAFNTFNRPNFGAPENRQRIARFGEIMTAGDPRIMQLGLKLRF